MEIKQKTKLIATYFRYFLKYVSCEDMYGICPSKIKLFNNVYHSKTFNNEKTYLDGHCNGHDTDSQCSVS